jgi:hypothetical protein
LRSGHLPGVFLAVLCLLERPAQAAAPSAAEADFFENQIRPVLVQKCLECHGDAKPKGGLKLTSRANVLLGGDSGPAAVAGKPDESLLVRAVRHVEKRRMPPREKLTARQIEALARWVSMGLPWPAKHATLRPTAERFTLTEEHRRFWSFQPVKPVAVPAVRDTTWSRSAVDRFILAALEAKGLAPAPPAGKRTLLRRATFDLIGLPPTPEEMKSFLADDSPGAFARVVDRLLASPHYGERWGRHWLDVVRYADARDLIQLPPPSDFREAWRYRDWVVGAFNRDMPYGDFLRRQIAGDLLPPDEPGGVNADGVVATGMLAIADFVPGDVDKDLMIADYVNDQIDVVGRAFMGLTLGCARCHDHKFDPVSTEDYYGLAGIFFSTRLIPGPVPGNTPLVRVPLWSKAAIEKANARSAERQRRRAYLQQNLSGAAGREYRSLLEGRVAAWTARYLVAACGWQFASAGKRPAEAREYARRQKLDEGLLTSWLAYLGADRPVRPGDPLTAWRGKLREAAAGKPDRSSLERSARKLAQALAAVGERRQREAKAAPEKRSLLLHFRADDPRLLTDAKGRVTLWPNLASAPADATTVVRGKGPLKTGAAVAGRTRQVLRFGGSDLLSKYAEFF